MIPGNARYILNCGAREAGLSSVTPAFTWLKLASAGIIHAIARPYHTVEERKLTDVTVKYTNVRVKHANAALKSKNVTSKNGKTELRPAHVSKKYGNAEKKCTDVRVKDADVRAKHSNVTLKIADVTQKYTYVNRE